MFIEHYNKSHTVLQSLHALSYLIQSTIPKVRCYYYLDITAKKHSRDILSSYQGDVPECGAGRQLSRALKHLYEPAPKSHDLNH